MIFQHTHEAVMNGTKTQTRRLVKPGDYAIATGPDAEYAGDWIDEVWHGSKERWVKTGNGNRLKWRLGSTYAVQAKRGGKALWWGIVGEDRDWNGVCTDPGRLIAFAPVFDAWDEAAGDSYTVTDEDGLRREGFIPLRIRITAIRREDVRQISDSDVTAEGFASREDFLRLWEQMHGPHYDAWVLTFERVAA